MIAFDYGATLRVSDGLVGLRVLVQQLTRSGVPIVVISALEGPPGTHDEKYREEILGLKGPDGDSLGINNVVFVYYPKNPTPEDMIKVGQDKANVMAVVGATVLFDDSDWVIQGVTSTGLHAVKATPLNV